MRRDLITHHLELSLRKSLEAPRLRLIELAGERPEIDEQREPWIPIKYGPAKPDDWFGVVRAKARYERAPGLAAKSLDLAIKVNPRQGLARTLIPWIVESKGIALDRPYPAYRRAAESDRTGARERNVYALAGASPALRSVLPRCYGACADDTTGEHALFIEYVDDVARLDASGAEADWPPELINRALQAAASWQAEFWDIGPERFAWPGPRPTTADMIADASLWRGLLDDARKRFPAIVTDVVWQRRHRLIDTIGEWFPAKDQLPATLAHNDFNQRNVGFHPDTLVLDWELIEFNTAHRDLVEMLTFVLPEAAGRKQIDTHVEGHRLALAELGISKGIDREAWMEGFRSEVKTEATNRINLQFLFGAAFPLAYLARINRNIERLLDMYG
jgi:aminoglycoside phosphotransferase (APT) family kinase protein